MTYKRPPEPSRPTTFRKASRNVKYKSLGSHRGPDPRTAELLQAVRDSGKRGVFLDDWVDDNADTKRLVTNLYRLAEKELGAKRITCKRAYDPQNNKVMHCLLRAA